MNPETSNLIPSASWSRRKFLAAMGAGVALGKMPAWADQSAAPALDAAINVFAGRPTDTSVTFNIIASRRGPWHVEWGSNANTLTQSREFEIDGSNPLELLLGDLTPATRYVYRIRPVDDPASPPAIAGAFCTARPPDEPFTFTLTADSHLPPEPRPADSPFGRAVRLAAAANPDFHLTLGDEAMTHHARYIAVTAEVAEYVYRSMRANYEPLARVAPIFFALGNHEGEGLGQRVAEASRTARLKLVANPAIDTYPAGGSPGQSYFAWEWGDAQFIVLDPYTNSPARPKSAEDWTLGAEQMNWLERTLAGSTRRWNLVFQHQLIGGSDYAQAYGPIGPIPFYGRGGASHAHVGEQKRIGELLQEHGGAVIFKGHDHVWADETRNGIRYTTCGRLSGSRPDLPRWGDDPKFRALYPNGFNGAWGFVRVDVSAQSLSVRYTDIFGKTLGEYTLT